MIRKAQVTKYGVIFAVATLAAIMVSAAQHYLVPGKQAPVLVVDTASVLTAKQVWFTQALIKPGISDADRVKVMEQTKQFVVDLDRELTLMQKKCDCVIFDKGAVIIGNYVEVTADLKKRLGL